MFGRMGGCEMVPVPAGEFQVEHDGGGGTDVRSRTVSVGAFLMDRREVTAREFLEFARRTGYQSQQEHEHNWAVLEGAGWRTGFPTWIDLDEFSGFDQLPAVDVSWFDAHAFAMAHGKDLPTEAEFEWALRRGGKGTQGATRGIEPDRPLPHAPPRGESGPPNALGIFDLDGGVREWCLDRHFEDFDRIHSPEATAPSLGRSCDGHRAIRGASYRSAPFAARPGYRFHLPPETRADDVGFRCVIRLDAVPVDSTGERSEPRLK
jgi:formylglycine-generating enzyme required for sulfatase activity